MCLRHINNIISKQRISKLVLLVNKEGQWKKLEATITEQHVVYKLTFN